MSGYLIKKRFRGYFLLLHRARNNQRKATGYESVRQVDIALLASQTWRRSMSRYVS